MISQGSHLWVSLYINLHKLRVSYVMLRTDFWWNTDVEKDQYDGVSEFSIMLLDLYGAPSRRENWSSTGNENEGTYRLIYTLKSLIGPKPVYFISWNIGNGASGLSVMRIRNLHHRLHLDFPNPWCDFGENLNRSKIDAKKPQRLTP